MFTVILSISECCFAMFALIWFYAIMNFHMQGKTAPYKEGFSTLRTIKVPFLQVPFEVNSETIFGSKFFKSKFLVYGIQSFDTCQVIKVQ